MQVFLCYFSAPLTTEFYTLSLHDALPIYALPFGGRTERIPVLVRAFGGSCGPDCLRWISRPLWEKENHLWAGDTRPCDGHGQDRKSTRLNSSHGYISYAVFCLIKNNY